MDARKIQFLIGIQREIDKLEAKDGNTPKVERVKSRFYDVVEVNKIAGESKAKSQEIDTKAIEPQQFDSTDVDLFSNQAGLKEWIESFSAEELNNMSNSHEEAEEIISNGLSGMVGRGNDTKKDILVATQNDLSESKKKAAITGKEIVAEPEIIFPHRPKDVAAFLVRFRDRKNRGLKYLTHRWSDMKRDHPLTYAEVIANATKEFWECNKQETIPVTLKSKVGQYVSAKSVIKIVDNKPKIVYPHFYYSTVIDGVVKRVNIYSGWSSDEMIEWVKNNPNSDPNQDDYWKKELIQPFKQAIEVRDGMFEKYMKMNAEAVLKTDYQKFNPIYGNSLKEARFFTDVPTLFEGIRKLLAAAKDSAKEPSLRFDYCIPDSTDLYGIRQIKIVTDKNPDVGSSSITKAQLTKGGDLGDAFDHFYGLCNWVILCKRGNEYVKINLLTDSDESPEIELIDKAEVEGFTHILTFYDL